MSFCTNCGNAVLEGTQFCTNCGTRLAPVQAASPAPPATPSQESPGASAIPPPPPWQPVPGETQPFTPAKTRSALPFVLVILGILALIAAGLVGGMVYVGYRVKQKVSDVTKVIKEQAPAVAESKPAGAPSGATPGTGDISSLLGSLSSFFGGTSDGGDSVPSISSKDRVDPCSPARYPSQANARIPLQAGTVVTIAWGVKHGDVETRQTIESVDPSSLTLSARTNEYTDDFNKQAKAAVSTHTVCNADLVESNEYATVTGRQPQIIHGITRLRLSDKAFREVKSTGKLNFIYWDVSRTGPDSLKPEQDGGVLTRVEPHDVPYPLIVNDERVTLPAIHLAGITASVGKDPRPKKDRPTHTETDLYFIDDPLDPLVLLLRMKDPLYHDNKFRIEDTKIDFVVPHPVNLVEKQLAETKKAVTWGIYFDFNQDTIKPESAPVLKEIAQALSDNPAWKLTVAGNTDNIGGDAYNLDLSRRRAASVKQALVSQYHVAAQRLATDGYGASHPIESNDSLEGRARNRRVELTRE